jgi:uncharacterized delta-60 repeat protein
MAVAVGLLLLSAACASAAESSNPPPVAVLDPTFGSAGVLEMPAESAVAASGIAIEDGGLLVSSGSGVHALNSAGGTGEAFGSLGSLAVPGASGGEFLITGLTVDTFGRLLVLGEALFPEAENPSPPLDAGGRVFRPSVVRIVRFLPDGALDPSFGQGGVVETGLGLSPPRDVDGRRLGRHPAIEPTGIAFDPRGRIIITGGAVVGLSDACRGRDRIAPVADSAGFVTRLEEDGELDTGFGTRGVVGGRSVAKSPLGAAGLGDPVISPVGSITVRATRAYVCGHSDSHSGLARLTPDGNPSRGFGRNGTIYGPYRALVGTPAGTIYALTEVPRPRPDKEPFTARLVRNEFLQAGPFDRAVGNGGQVTVKLGRGYETRLDALAIDNQGRILIGGSMGIGDKNFLALLRVSKDGRWERDFGPHGRVAVPVPRPAEYGDDDMFFDASGRLVDVRLYTESAGGGSPGLMVARYLLRN